MANLNKELAAKVVARKKRIIEYTQFINNLLGKMGNEVFYQMSSCHTHITQELTYRGFLFQGDYGLSMMGGNRLGVWFDYGLKETPIQKVRQNLVLQVYCQTSGFAIDNCLVEHFDESLLWQHNLDKFVDDFENVIRDLEKIEAERVKKLNAEQRAREEAILLKREATRLGISLATEND